jgi:hypothetical protein
MTTLKISPVNTKLVEKCVLKEELSSFRQRQRHPSNTTTVVQQDDDNPLFGRHQRHEHCSTQLTQRSGREETNVPSLLKVTLSSSSDDSINMDSFREDAKQHHLQRLYSPQNRSLLWLTMYGKLWNDIDITLSRLLFEWKLPMFMEAMFSIPACFFGLIPAVWVGPLVIAMLALPLDESTQDDDRNQHDAEARILQQAQKQQQQQCHCLTTIVGMLSVSFLLAWALFLRGKRWPLSHFLGKKILYPLGVPWSIGILNYFLKGNHVKEQDCGHDEERLVHNNNYNKVFSSSIYSLYLWCWAVLIVLILKKWSKRLRPCLNYSRPWMVSNKNFSVIPILLSQLQPDESFPSGDVACAAALAIPMLCVGSNSSRTVEILGFWNVSVPITAVAYGMVLLAGIGRVYFLAHHVTDVLVGAMIPFIVHYTSTIFGLGVYDMKWWYPVIANTVVIIYAKLAEKNSSPKKSESKRLIGSQGSARHYILCVSFLLMILCWRVITATSATSTIATTLGISSLSSQRLHSKIRMRSSDPDFNSLHRLDAPIRWQNNALKSTGLPVLGFRGGGFTTKSDPKRSNSLTKAIVQRKTKEGSPSKDNPTLLVLFRILFFAYYASLGSLLPYLPVYYHSLGHGGQIIGMLGAIKPFTTFLVAPLWGIISDSTGSPFTVLYFTFLVSLLAQLLVAFRHDPRWIMAMVFTTAFFNAPVKSLLDAMVIGHLEDRSKYGRLRLWGQLGFGVGSSGVGFLLSHSKHRPYTPPLVGTSVRDHLDEVWQSMTGYKLLFFTHALLSIPTFLLIRTFDNWTKDPSHGNSKQSGKVESKLKDLQKKKDEKSSVWQGIQLLFQNSDALLFFSLVLVVGISSGVIENFAYVRIREVGGTGREMGLSRLVSSMAGAPMFWYSGPLTEMLGADRVLVLSLMSYVVRYFNYAFMQSPLQGLPAEALRGLTFAAFWSTCTIYASRIAPEGMQATMVSNECWRLYGNA